MCKQVVYQNLFLVFAEYPQSLVRNLEVCDQLLSFYVECFLRFVEAFVCLDDMLRDLSQFVVGEGGLHRHFDRLVTVGAHGELPELIDGSTQSVGELIEDDH